MRDYTNIKIKPVKTKYGQPKTILCFDLDGNFVRLFKDKWLAIEFLQKEKGITSKKQSIYSGITVNLNQKQFSKSSYGFQWIYEKDIDKYIKGDN